MEKKFTFYARTVAYTVFIFGVLVFNPLTSKIYAQSCSGATALFTETFGTGVGSVSWPDVVGLTYQQTGPLINDGTYRVIDDVWQNPEWHASEDGTSGDIDGRMLVTNGTAGTFYTHQINRPGGFLSGDFAASLFLMNLDPPSECLNPLDPAISVRIEYLSQNNTWVPFGGSPYNAPAAIPTIDPVWVHINPTFQLPPTGTFLVKSVRIVLSDATVGGCGNDFSVDQITLLQCTAIGPLPIQLLDVNSRQKGSGVSIEWSTSQEINSKSFVVEKSADGNSNWNVVASVSAAGNSSTVINYNAFDPRPFNGNNFYRLMQMDKDGSFRYSKVMNIKLNFISAGVSVLTNPFHNSLTVDFSSSTNQEVSVRMVDITGKQVAAEKWSIGSGSTRKDFSNVSRLQQGMYILTVFGEDGKILCNTKVIKQ